MCVCLYLFMYVCMRVCVNDCGRHKGRQWHWKLIITHVSDQWSVPLVRVQFSNYAKCYENVCGIFVWGDVEDEGQ